GHPERLGEGAGHDQVGVARQQVGGVGGAELAVGLVDHDRAGGGGADGGERLGAGGLAGRVVGRAPEGQVGGGLGHQVGGGGRVEQLVAGLEPGDQVGSGAPGQSTR